MMCIHMRFADQFFATMVFGTPYCGDFFCTEYTYTQTLEVLSNVFLSNTRSKIFKVEPFVMKTQTTFRNEKLPIFRVFWTRTVQNQGSDTIRNGAYSNNALSVVLQWSLSDDHDNTGNSKIWMDERLLVLSF